MAFKKLPVVAGILVVTALSVLVAIQQNQLRHLQEPHARPGQSAMSGSGAPGSWMNRIRLPAPALPRGAGSSRETPETRAAELHALFHVPKLTIEQAEKFLAENRRSAASLVAAFRTSGEGKFLAEAMLKYPKDPQVAFEAIFKGDLPPGERRKWIDALKQSSPENALANYLSAQDYFRSGQTDLAVGELEAAFGKAKFDDLTLERMQNNEEAYRANGFSEAESRNVAMFQLPLPLLNEMKALTENMTGLSKSYRLEGDTVSADSTVAITLKLGEHFRNAGNALLVHQMLGIGMEQSALKTLDPEAVFAPAGITPQELLHDLNADQAALSQLVRETVALQDLMSPQDWVVYIDRMKLLGEPNAMRWLQTRFGPP